MKKIRLTESELIRMIKKVIKENEGCNKTFDELKDEVNTKKSWTLKKTDGVWSLLTKEGFCTKDITLYGVREKIQDTGQMAYFEKYDEVNNKIFFGYFNVGPGK